MTKHDVLGIEIWECTGEEARQLWVDFPDDRHRIWTTEEFTAHILDDPAKVQDCLNRKKRRPGKI